MIKEHKTLYVVKQKNNYLWRFLFNPNKGLLYQKFIDNQWSDYNVLIDNIDANFSINLLPDDSINILYKDSLNNIFLYKYINEKWILTELIDSTNGNFSSIYFQSINIENTIFLFFNIYNDKSKLSTIFYEVLNEENELSNPTMIDIIKHNYVPPFKISCNEEKIYILYQKSENLHELGYKVFNKDDASWSKFNNLDKSANSFIDYSAIIFNNKLHAFYIKKENSINKLIYIQEKILNSVTLFSDKNLNSVLANNLNEKIYYSYLTNDAIYISNSLENVSSFSENYYKEKISFNDLIEISYISSYEDKKILTNNLYIPKFSNLSSLLQINSSIYFDVNKDFLFYFNHYNSELKPIFSLNSKESINDELSTLKNSLSNEKENIELLKNDNIELLNSNELLNSELSTLKISLSDEKEKNEFLKNENTKLLNSKELLDQELFLLNNNFFDEKEKVTFLQKIICDKDDELFSLKETIYMLKKETEKLNKEILDLKGQLKFFYNNIKKNKKK